MSARGNVREALLFIPLTAFQVINDGTPFCERTVGVQSLDSDIGISQRSYLVVHEGQKW